MTVSQRNSLVSFHSVDQPGSVSAKSDQFSLSDQWYTYQTRLEARDTTSDKSIIPVTVKRRGITFVHRIKRPIPLFRNFFSPEIANNNIFRSNCANHLHLSSRYSVKLSPKNSLTV